MPLKSAIYQGESIWHDTKYHVVRSLANGITVGAVDGHYIAISAHLLKGQVSLRPVVGQWSPDGKRWVLDSMAHVVSLKAWFEGLNMPRLELERRLKGHVEKVKYVKAALRNWSVEDVATVKELGWLAGFSIRSPLLCIYLLIPNDVWVGGDVPVFDGQLRKLTKFGPMAMLSQIR